MRKYLTIVAATGMLLACVSGAQGLDMEWVTVGDPGNVGELSGEGAGGHGPDRICGAVDYVYNIGKYEVTNSQYAEFLNAVAGADPYGLYTESMGSGYGGITRSGSSPNYTYSAIQGRANMPVNWVSWYDTLRFANWMHNGQPTGAQDASTTEDGAYDMSLNPEDVFRKPGALVFLPSEDEWYKAAYYKGGGTSAGYWDYPTQSDSAPKGENPPGTDMTNGSANYGLVVGDLTDVAAYTAKPSDSAYGTFDQGGNVWEWNEADIYGDGCFRGSRGGSFDNYDNYLCATERYSGYPTFKRNVFGFRVAEVPEPATLSLLALGGLLLIRRRR